MVINHVVSNASYTKGKTWSKKESGVGQPSAPTPPHQDRSSPPPPPRPASLCPRRCLPVAGTTRHWPLRKDFTFQASGRICLGGAGRRSKVLLFRILGSPVGTQKLWPQTPSCQVLLRGLIAGRCAAGEQMQGSMAKGFLIDFDSEHLGECLDSRPCITLRGHLQLAAPLQPCVKTCVTEYWQKG